MSAELHMSRFVVNEGPDFIRPLCCGEHFFHLYAQVRGDRGGDGVRRAPIGAEPGSRTASCIEGPHRADGGRAVVVENEMIGMEHLTRWLKLCVGW